MASRQKAWLHSNVYFGGLHRVDDHGANADRIRSHPRANGVGDYCLRSNLWQLTQLNVICVYDSVAASMFLFSAAIKSAALVNQNT